MAEIRKVWTCIYKGKVNRAPHMLSVPSVHTVGRPTSMEMEAALIAMGFSRGDAVIIRGSNLDWDFK